MKVSINSARGVNVQPDGTGVEIEGQPHQRAAFGGQWIDHFAEIHEGTGPAALTYEPYRNTGFELHFFRSNQNDKAFMVYQMPHGWDRTAVRPHMHCIPMASGSGDVIFEYNYCWAPYMSEVPAASGWVTGSVTASFTPDDQYKHEIVSFGTIDISGSVGPSTMLFFACTRMGATNAGDTYDTGKDHGTAAANLAIAYFDTHLRLAKAGTDTEFDDY